MLWDFVPSGLKSYDWISHSEKGKETLFLKRRLERVLLFKMGANPVEVINSFLLCSVWDFSSAKFYSLFKQNWFLNTLDNFLNFAWLKHFDKVFERVLHMRRADWRGYWSCLKSRISCCYAQKCIFMGNRAIRFFILSSFLKTYLRQSNYTNAQNRIEA